MDLSKFLSACTFMYLQDSVNEKHIQSIAKILCTTPDATTDLPVSLLDDLKEDPVAKLFFQILVRIRHCMCLFESGPGSPDNEAQANPVGIHVELAKFVLLSFRGKSSECYIGRHWQDVKMPKAEVFKLRLLVAGNSLVQNLGGLQRLLA